MITNFNKKNRKDDIKVLICLIIGFLLVVWLCTPPGNKLAQLALYGNNTQFMLAKFTKSSDDLNEWLYHRNNAVYYVRMNDKKNAYKEIDLAIKSYPAFLSDSNLTELYLTRAKICMYYKDYNGALSDYIRSNNLSMLDTLRVAMLFKEAGNKKFALLYCNEILNSNSSAYVGYACVADIYASAGRYDTAVNVYNLLIDKNQNRALYYLERAEYKKLAGDILGYDEDKEKAKSVSSNLGTPFKVLKDSLSPESLDLNILRV